MKTKQGDLSLLDHPVAQELLQSKVPAQLAYSWLDGSPRVVPIWFHWNGKEVILGSPMKAPKLKALRMNSKVAVSIDSDTRPYHVLQIRGTARTETVEGCRRSMRRPRSATWAKRRGARGPVRSRG